MLVILSHLQREEKTGGRLSETLMYMSMISEASIHFINIKASEDGVCNNHFSA